MSEEHVGVVHVGHASYDVGVHIADHVADAKNRIQQIADSVGRPPTHSVPSSELQVVARRLHLPEQQDEVVRLSLELLRYLSKVPADRVHPSRTTDRHIAVSKAEKEPT